MPDEDEFERLLLEGDQKSINREMVRQLRMQTEFLESIEKRLGPLEAWRERTLGALALIGAVAWPILYVLLTELHH